MNVYIHKGMNTHIYVPAYAYKLVNMDMVVHIHMYVPEHFYFSYN
jgi:hypothetical protein